MATPGIVVDFGKKKKTLKKSTPSKEIKTTFLAKKAPHPTNKKQFWSRKKIT